MRITTLGRRGELAIFLSVILRPRYVVTGRG